tara:strand:- start:487 stop:660 length:174 start_codon:yes stop_codon:yes gene_type:complete
LISDSYAIALREDLYSSIFSTPSHGYSTTAAGSQAIESYIKSFARFDLGQGNLKTAV